MRAKLFIGVLATFLAIPMFAANAAKTSAKKPEVRSQAKSQWPAEDLMGSVMEVKPGMNLLIMKDSSGVPFDLRVTKATKIELNGSRVPLDQIKADADHQVSVRIKPERRGDIAESIEVSS